MHYGIKISKIGFDVTDNNKPRQDRQNIRSDYIIYTLALPYLNGGYSQINRYLQAVSFMEKSRINGVIRCLHEVSTLFEDLDTVSRYISVSGKEHDLHLIIRNVRNHIRHDIRENFDKENHKYKVERNNILKIHKNLQTNIGFAKESIKIGEVIITLQEIKEYLDWSSKIINEALNIAKEKGFIKIE